MMIGDCPDAVPRWGMLYHPSKIVSGTLPLLSHEKNLTLSCVYLTINVIKSNLSYALFDSLYEMPTPDFERTSASVRLPHWSQYRDMPSINGISTVDRKPCPSTDLGVYNAWRSDMWVCMICWDTNDADRFRACMLASVLTVCTPFSIQNIILWCSCGTSASPTSSSDPLKTHGSVLPA